MVGPNTQRLRGLAASVVAAGLLAATAGAAPALTVSRVVDGDTIVVSSGARIRLVQIDTPEVDTGECYSRAAARVLRRLIPDGTPIGLETDPRLDQVDRYERLLRYVRRGSMNVNLELVRVGAATVWFYDGDRGRYADELLNAARQARSQRLGLWGACDTVWDPYGPARTFPKR